MFFVFHLTFSENFLGLGIFLDGKIDNQIFGTDALNSPGVIIANLINYLVGLLENPLNNLFANAPSWLSSLALDGIFQAIATVISFIPQIMLLFLFLSILEESGYMARVVVLFDRQLRKLGLSGKALIPLLLCFGCAVPGLMAAKALDDKKEKKLAIMVSPYFSCGAKLPIWAIFGAVLFGGQFGDLVVFAMYFIGIFSAILVMLIVNRFIYKGEVKPLIIELPPYHSPRVRNTLLTLWEKLKHFLTRASTIIMGAIVVIWFGTHIKFNFTFTEEMANSIFGIISTGISYIFVPLGFGGKPDSYMFIISIITGFLAKELVPVTMATLAGIESIEGSEGLSYLGNLVSIFGVPAIFSFMTFNLLTMPCMAAVGTAKSVLTKKHDFLKLILFWLLNSYFIALVLYWSLTILAIGIVVIILIVAIFVYLLLIEPKLIQKKLEKLSV
jgi:ferrous iron transport protein B